jgi:CelD/BcsL family acetyltransferase involved in cellulose biosynthesis
MNNLKIDLLQSPDELAKLGREWNGLLEQSITRVPFLRHEYLTTWWGTRGGGEWPQAELACLTARRDGQLAGIAPLFFARNREGESALLLLGSIEISDYLDLIVRPTDLRPVLSGMLDFLAGQERIPWQVLDWHNLPQDSPTLTVLEDLAAQRGWSCRMERTYHVPSIPLPGDFEAYLAGIDKKQRHEIRRKIHRAEENGQVTWYIVQDSAKLDAEVDAFLALMSEDPKKTAFLTAPMRAQIVQSCRAAFENGWLQLAFLEVGGQKAAAYLNFDYLNRIWVYNSGMDRRFLDLSAGWVLLGYLLQWANEHGRTEFDFLRGDEEYKYRFGGVDRFVMRARVLRA